MKALLVIYMCWTPIDSANLAVQHGYTLKSAQEDSYRFELWDINGRELEVTYTHPVIGNQDNLCYYSERWTDENNIIRLPLNKGYNPDA